MALEIREEHLNLEAVVGFNGRVPHGLVYHPDGVHIIYPLGSTIVIKNTVENTQAFLQGHTDRVTCLALSPDGKYIASGQAASIGFKAPVIVWDVEAAIRNANTAEREGELVHQLLLHKSMIQDVTFSCNGEYIASLGGADDNTLVVWDVESGEAICGSPASTHAALTVRFLRHNPLVLVTAGHNNLRKWDLNLDRRRLFPADILLGSLKRVIHCLAIDDTDTFVWCGTQSGDLLEVNINNLRFVRASRNRFSLGITSAVFAANPSGGADFVLIGSGDGALVRLSTEALQIDSAVQLMGGVSSISLSRDESRAFVGTLEGNTYVIDVDSFEPHLRSTAHDAPVNDVIFPRGCGELFLTCAGSNIRLWNADTRAELLRIQVPNLECRSLAILPDGSAILSGWDDGKVRAFLPESGKLRFVITDAHADAVTALAPTNDGKTLVSGGQDGRLRFWDIAGATQRMIASFKEHKGAVTSIVVSGDDDECVSSGADGACIVWNLRRRTRQNALYASTLFRQVAYHPDESQLVTVGSDRKVGFWDAVECTPIRMLDASVADVCALDVSRDGEFLVTGGADRLVRAWGYDEGVPFAAGQGHSGTVNRLRISPDGHKVVSVGSEGGIFVWTVPEVPEELHRLAAEALGEEGSAGAGGGEVH